MVHKDDHSTAFVIKMKRELYGKQGLDNAVKALLPNFGCWPLISEIKKLCPCCMDRDDEVERLEKIMSDYAHNKPLFPRTFDALREYIGACIETRADRMAKRLEYTARNVEVE